MTSGAPWSVKGIDPKAREVAKDLARRSGMTLGEWLNRVILEDDGPDEVTSHDQFAERPTRSYFQTSRGGGEAPARYEAPEHPADEVARVVTAFDRISARLEEAETRTGLAITGVEHSVREALARIEAGEREQVAVAARFEGAVEELSSSQVRLAERLRKYDGDSGPRSAEALRSLEQALGKVAGHLYDGESRTRAIIDAVAERVERIEQRGSGDPAGVADAVVGRLGERLAEAEARTTGALEGLRASFAALDGRLKAVESVGVGQGDLRLEDLATGLSQRVEAVRAEVAEKLRASADERFDRMERKLGEMTQHVRTGEQRSAHAIEQMGREVLTVAETLNRRVQTAEVQSAQAIEQVGGEVARIATAMETRLGRTDNVHAQALERLGGEIARITERLGERIGAAERRSAQAIDEVGEQVVRATEKLNLRHERDSQELSDRIRQSEERTAKLLEEAREKIDQRLGDVGRGAGPASHVGARTTFTPFGAAPFADFGPPEPDHKAAEPAFEPPPLKAFPAAAEVEDSKEPAFAEEDFEAADGFGPVAAAEPEFEPEPEDILRSALQSAPGFEPPAAPAAPAQGHAAFVAPDDDDFDAETEFLGDARPSAFAPDAEAPRAEEELSADDIDLSLDDDARADDAELFEPDADLDDPEAFKAGQLERAADLAPEIEVPARPLTTREVIEQARAAARASASNGDKAKKDGGQRPIGRPTLGSLFSGLGRRGSKKSRNSTLQTALLIAGGAAFLSVGAAGLVVMSARPGGAPPQRVADQIAQASAPFGDNPRAAIALSPQSLSQVGAGPTAPSAPAPAGPELEAAYQAAVEAVKSGQPDGLETLKKTANIGYGPAQRYLAKLYEAGGSGVKKDPVEARRWTERAAQGGDRLAMHDLALYHIRGVGGPKNAPLAAQWFHRAADLGLVDSQFNLGLLYEKGIGVPQNMAEAYKWYLIAGRSGDAESRSSAQRARAGLSPAGQAVVERAAGGYRAAVPGQVAAAGADAMVTAQRALSRLGYYQGPRDGSPSPALTMAVAAYQREQGLPPTGGLDDVTVARLTVFTR
ncbi:peptidoglycan-binding protein [Phenylobacterium sp.]|jgi:localization factor PodJL|uniref:peptidoglycan-binding protein n=1 Tax=Phenylobacterium sp. TaxID=1871053 RepID=UPI002F3FA7B4